MPSDDHAIIRDALRNILAIHRHRAEFASKLGEAALETLIADYERQLAKLWQAVAEVRALEAVNRRTDPGHPGYVIISAAGAEVFVPFHLVPALPDAPVLAEALELAAKVRLGGKNATICLSGSTLLMGDIARIGDLDFCEYYPKARSKAELQRAFSRLVDASSGSHFVIALRARASLNAPFQDLQIDNRSGPLQEAAIDRIAGAMAVACNGKANFLVMTSFAGTIEATNWVIFHLGKIDSDPTATLSFAFQEAPLGLSAGRSLTLFESVAAYLFFLTGEIARYAAKDPVKAIKRAIPLLRLFGAAELLDELLAEARKARAFSGAAALARLELGERYATLHRPELPLGQLKADGEALAAEALGRAVSADDAPPLVRNELAKFAAQLQSAPGGPIWERILAVAENP